MRMKSESIGGDNNPELRRIFSSRELQKLSLLVIPVILLLLKLALLSEDVSANNSSSLLEKIHDPDSVVTFCLENSDEFSSDNDRAWKTLQQAIQLFNGNKPDEWGVIDIGLKNCDVDFTFVEDSTYLQEICQPESGSTSIACALTGTNQVYIGPSDSFNACKPEEMVAIHEFAHVAGVEHPAYNTQETWYTFMNPSDCYYQDDLEWQIETVFE